MPSFGFHSLELKHYLHFVLFVATFLLRGLQDPHDVHGSLIHNLRTWWFLLPVSFDPGEQPDKTSKALHKVVVDDLIDLKGYSDCRDISCIPGNNASHLSRKPCVGIWKLPDALMLNLLTCCTVHDTRINRSAITMTSIWLQQQNSGPSECPQLIVPRLLSMTPGAFVQCPPVSGSSMVWKRLFFFPPCTLSSNNVLPSCYWRQRKMKSFSRGDLWAICSRYL